MPLVRITLAYKQRSVVAITAIFFILIILPLIKIGYSVTIPFLIFGSFILIISLFIDIIFERARKLNNSV